MEQWKKIENFEYEISTLGRCRSIDRTIMRRNGWKQTLKGKILKPIVCTNGYLEYQLCNCGKNKTILAHRLVAKAFIPNPENKKEVNHKNEIIQDNRVENLEWVTSKENANYGTRNIKCRECNRKNFKPVEQYSKDGTFIKRYECTKDAARELNIGPENIQRAALQIANRKYAKGFIWKFC